MKICSVINELAATNPQNLESNAIFKTKNDLNLLIMKKIILLPIILLILISLGCNTSNRKSENEQKVVESTHRKWASEGKGDTIETKEEKRFYGLTKCLQEKFEGGKIKETKDSIKELKVLLSKYLNNWNYGNATHKINITMGRIALRDGKIDEAKMYLIEAGKTQGSPQLDSFGPNMSLAKELLEKGEKKVVLEYFDLCRVFWKTDYSKLDTWTADVKNDRIPDFGANLIF